MQVKASSLAQIVCLIRQMQCGEVYPIPPSAPFLSDEEPGIQGLFETPESTSNIPPPPSYDESQRQYYQQQRYAQQPAYNTTPHDIDLPPKYEYPQQPQGNRLYPNLFQNQEQEGSTKPINGGNASEEEETGSSNIKPAKKGKKPRKGRENPSNREESENMFDSYEFLKEFAKFEASIDSKRKNAQLYHKSLCQNGFLSNPKIPYSIFDQILAKTYPKFANFLQNFNPKKEQLKIYIESTLTPHIYYPLKDEKPIEISPHFKTGSEAIFSFLKEIRKMAIDPNNAGYRWWSPGRYLYPDRFNPDAEKAKINNALDSLNILLDFFKSKKSTKINEIATFSELCSQFILHLDCLETHRVFSSDDNKFNVHFIVTNTYIDLLKLNFLLPSLLRNHEETGKSNKQKSARFEFLINEFSTVLRSFNVNSLTLLELIESRFINTPIFSKQVYRTLALIRTINSLFKLVGDVLLPSKAIGIAKSTKKSPKILEIFVDDIAFIESNITLYNIQENYTESAEFESFLDRPLKFKSLISLRSILPWFRKGNPAVSPDRLSFSTCKDILTPLTSEISDISLMYTDNGIDKSLKQTAEMKKEKEVMQVIKERFPNLAEQDNERVFDIMIEITLLLTGVNLSSAKSTIGAENGVEIVLERFRKAFKSVNYFKFTLNNFANEIISKTINELDRENKPMEYISYQSNSLVPTLNLILKRFDTSSQTQRERDLLREIGELDAQYKMALIVAVILLFFVSILLLLNHNSKTRIRRISKSRAFSG